MLADPEIGRPIFPTESLERPYFGVGLQIALSLVAIAIVGLLCFGKVTRKETATGILTSGELALVPNKAGTVATVYMTEGQTVRAGQPIVQVATEQDAISSTFNDESLQSLERQIDVNRTKLDAYNSEAAIEREKLQQKLRGDVAGIELLKIELPNEEQRVQAAKIMLDKGGDLLKQGAGSQLQIQGFLFEYLNDVKSLNELKLRIEQQQQSLKDDQFSLGQLPNKQTQDRNTLDDAIASLEGKRINVLSSINYAIKSKIDGRISWLRASVGQPIAENEPIGAIVPTGGRLFAEIYIPSRASGFIRLGQRVRLLYEAFPYQRFGAGEGFIEAMSATVVKPGDLGTPAVVSEPVYKVKVRLSHTNIYAFGKYFSLAPGMKLTADVMLDRQPIYQYLLQPLFAIKGRL